VDRAHRLGPLIAANAEVLERLQRLPPPLAEALHESRLLRLLLPRSLGGEQTPPGDYFRAIEALGRYDGSVAWNAFVANSAALIAPFMAEPAARAIFSDPKAVVAWGPPNRNRAYVVPGGYRLSGTWGFASGCRLATWMGAHCVVKEPDGSTRLGPLGTPAVVSFLFPASEATIHDDWGPTGLRGTGSCSYTLERVFVPDGYTGTREAPEAHRDRDPLYAFPQQALYAVGVAGVAQGIAGAMLDAFRALAAEKSPRGVGRLADQALVRHQVALAVAKLGAARAWLLDIVDEVYERAPPEGAIGLEDRARVRLGCSYAIQMAVEVGDTVHRAAGVSAIFPDSEFERRFRDLHTLSQQIQSRLAHFESTGAVLLGHVPEVFY